MVTYHRFQVRLTTQTVVSLALVGVCRPLAGQSLADLARQEEARRKSVKAPAKVITNKDLGGVPAASPAPPPAPASSTPGIPASPAARPAQESKAAEGGKVADSNAPARDQAYWSARLKALQTDLDRDETYRDALQSRINALTADFVGRDDPAQRARIERDRQKNVGEFNRLKVAIEADKKAIADLEEEARRAGVPPGWLR